MGGLEDGDDDAAHLPQVGQLGLDPFQDLLETPVLARAGGITCIQAAEGIDDLVEGEPEGLEPTW